MKIENQELRKSKFNQKSIKKITLGTKEWSDYSVNCINGCSNNCRYCYAKKMALRFGRKTENSWKIMEIRSKDVIRRYNKRKGRFMFPTSHDITSEPKVLESCLKVLSTLVNSGNEVLVTTKPNLEVIKIICERLEKFQDQIQFRFTITSDNNDLLSFWEPNAPLFEERFNSLKYSFNYGYKTSVSVEPFLSRPSNLVLKLLPFISESIWVGPMNYIRRNGLLTEEKIYYTKLRALLKPKMLFEIYCNLKKLKESKIRYKDSFLIKLSKANLIDSHFL